MREFFRIIHRPIGSSCVSNEDCCLGNNEDTPQCISISGGGSTCAAECVNNSDCESGCCGPLDNSSVSVCVASQFCE